MEIIQKPLPESCYSPQERLLTDLIVVHHISAIHTAPRSAKGEIILEKAYSMQACYDLLVELGLSYHYLYGRDGEVWQLMPDEAIAWHAGKSEWNHRRGCNSFSQGHCFIGSYLDTYTQAQYLQFEQNAATIMSKYNLQRHNIVGHRDIAGDDIRGEGRGKKDPNRGFDWGRLDESLGFINKDMSK